MAGTRTWYPANARTRPERKAPPRVTLAPPRTPPVCLPVGKGNRRLGLSKGKICPSDSQREWLKAEKLLGCGSFACAYERSDGKVVKITQDPADVYNLIEGQDHPRVVRVFDARELKHGARARKPYYAVVVEKLDVDPNLSRMVNWLPTTLLDSNYDNKQRHGETGEAYFVTDKIKDVFAQKCKTLRGKSKDDVLEKECQNVSKGLIDLHEYYGARDIKFVDIHGGNVGVDASGRWKALDIGFAKTPPPKVPLLAQIMTQALGLFGNRRKP